jgi:hypothetical protein
MPELGQVTPDFPLGYGCCQCGCGNKTKSISGGYLRYFHPSHNPKWQANRKERPPKLKVEPQAPDASAQSNKGVTSIRSGTQDTVSTQHELSPAALARCLERQKMMEQIRGSMRQLKVSSVGKGFRSGARPKDFPKQSPLLSFPVKQEVWDALMKNKDIQGRLLPEIMRAIRNNAITFREVSRVLGKPLHTAAQWYRSQLLEELQGRLSAEQQNDPEETFRRGKITQQELQVLQAAKVRSLNFLIWKERNIERYLKRHRAYTTERFREDPEFRERMRAAGAKWLANNREKYNKSRKNWLYKDVSARLADRLRSRIRSVLKVQGAPKFSNLSALIGCSIGALRSHLETKFLPGMSWDNYGQWHVDHIVPCAAFDLSQPEHQQTCFHYTNLQPLWGRDNIRKGKSLRHDGASPR